MSKKPFSDRIAYIFMLATIFLTGAAYGGLSDKTRAFPMKQINDGIHAWRALKMEGQRQWYVNIPAGKQAVVGANDPALESGLIMLSGINDDRLNFVRIIDREGSVVNERVLDWFEIWPDSSGFPKFHRPVTQPGATLHGVEILPNGDFIANFEHLSTMRVSGCGDIVWKLDNLGHHVVEIDEQDNIWVGSQNIITENPTGELGHVAPLFASIVQKISMDGQILETISILDVLRKNDLLGLMHMSTLSNETTEVWGDTMHLNDIDIFPSGMESSIFEAGDMMISLRNINTVFVMSPDTHEIKFISTGTFLRQHDPDFIGGDQILVFDNRNYVPTDGVGEKYSRIMKIDAVSGVASVYFQDDVQRDDNSRFFTDIMGKQQLLDNGNLLVTSPRQGRAFEVSPASEILWDYNNLIDEGYNGLLTQATLLPQYMDKDFFEGLTASCQ